MGWESSHVPLRHLAVYHSQALDTIAVEPSCWRSGIGRRLMSVALDHLVIDGYREAVLWTLASYPRGQQFYAATGWSSDGGTRDQGRQIRYRHSLVS